jgi:hypothetical protein
LAVGVSSGARAGRFIGSVALPKFAKDLGCLIWRRTCWKRRSRWTPAGAWAARKFLPVCVSGFMLAANVPGCEFSEFVRESVPGYNAFGVQMLGTDPFTPKSTFHATRCFSGELFFTLFCCFYNIPIKLCYNGRMTRLGASARKCAEPAARGRMLVPTPLCSGRLAMPSRPHFPQRQTYKPAQGFTHLYTPINTYKHHPRKKIYAPKA